MPTPALDAVDFEWPSGGSVDASTPALDAVEFTWQSITSTVHYAQNGTENSRVGTPRILLDSTYASAHNVAGIQSSKVGVPEIELEPSAAEVPGYRVESIAASSRVGTPSIDGDGIYAAFTVASVRPSSAVGAPSVEMLFDVGTIAPSGGVGVPLTITGHEVEGFTSSHVGGPSVDLTYTVLPMAPASRVGTPWIERAEHC